MRKIISILLVLGLVLGLSVVAAPTGLLAQEEECEWSVNLTDDCTGAEATYCVTFNITASLDAGVDYIILTFGVGTTFDDFEDGDIRVRDATYMVWDDVAGDDVDVAGTQVKFLVPAYYAATTLNPETLTVCVDGVTNPADGDHELGIAYQLVCCGPEEIGCAEYTILPATSTYKFEISFNSTYPGIAPGFIPPFKACGQNGTDQPYKTYEFEPGKWANNATLVFSPDVLGCAAPCANATMWFVPTAIEPDAEVYLSFNGTAYNLTDEDEGDEFDLDNIDPLAANTTITWELLLHFDTVGQYQICFYAECKVGTCEPGTQTWSKCFDFDVKQWKDAFPIELNEKWNLISLPLVPFDSDIDVMLESLNADATDALVNVWHYDRGDDKWFAWSPNGQTQLTDIVDGKSYWFRMKYPDTKDPYTWWVWGTEKPMPEHGPAQYDVYTGWNMAGFVSLSSMLVEAYLWNWPTAASFPVVYGWTPDDDWLNQGWYLVPAGDSLNSGEGYWMAFPSNGAIYAP